MDLVQTPLEKYVITLEEEQMLEIRINRISCPEGHLKG